MSGRGAGGSLFTLGSHGTFAISDRMACAGGTFAVPAARGHSHRPFRRRSPAKWSAQPRDHAAAEGVDEPVLVRPDLMEVDAREAAGEVAPDPGDVPVEV